VKGCDETNHPKPFERLEVIFENKKLSIGGSAFCHQIANENTGDPQSELII
jgi:hypothetical protein